MARGRQVAFLRLRQRITAVLVQPKQGSLRRWKGKEDESERILVCVSVLSGLSGAKVRAKLEANPALIRTHCFETRCISEKNVTCSNMLWNKIKNKTSDNNQAQAGIIIQRKNLVFKNNDSIQLAKPGIFYDCMN